MPGSQELAWLLPLQGLLKKHEAFETDFTVHKDRVNDICTNGQDLVKKNNRHEENISSKMKGLNGKVSDLEKAASQRKAKLDENSAFLQFNWKADVVESWIGKRSLGAAGISVPPEQMIFFCGEETGGMWAYQRPSPLGRPLVTAGDRVLRQRARPQRCPGPVWG